MLDAQVHRCHDEAMLKASSEAYLSRSASSSVVESRERLRSEDFQNLFLSSYLSIIESIRTIRSAFRPYHDIAGNIAEKGQIFNGDHRSAAVS